MDKASQRELSDRGQSKATMREVLGGTLQPAPKAEQLGGLLIDPVINRSIISSSAPFLTPQFPSFYTLIFKADCNGAQCGLDI